MDALELALTMKRLTVWLDRACQPAGFVQKQYDGPPFGRCYVSIDPGRQAQTASANWNRIHLCGAEPGLTPEGIEQLIDRYRAAGVNRFFAWLSPGPHMDVIRSWLEHAGFEPRMQWTHYPTCLAATCVPPRFRTELEVREVTAREVAAARKILGDTMWDEYERSAGKVGFHHFMAFDRAQPVAVAALAVFEGLGYLTFAATAESHRQRGAQSALIARRIDRARALGCTVLAVDTLTMLQHSTRNLERAGFRVAYQKEVYEWSPDNDAGAVVVAKPSPRQSGDKKAIREVGMTEETWPTPAAGWQLRARPRCPGRPAA